MENMIYLYQDHRNKNGFYINCLIKANSGDYFEVQERIASGGNAVVHKCEHSITGEVFAIKFQLSVNERRLKRFRQEINLLKTITHKQLVKYIDDGFIKGKNGNSNSQDVFFIIMELADNNLFDYLRENNKSINYAEYIGQFKGLALALATLHEKAIHRDIKPENVLISGGTWLLSDLGLCRFNGEDAQDLTKIHENIGPRLWMSPEALNRTLGNMDEIQKQSDVFQLCAIFWFVVTGRNPFGVVSKEDWNGPEHIFDVIFKALSHDPTKRPKDGKELYDLLNEATLAEAFGT